MNIVFFGTSEFALGALHRLTDSKHRVLAVVTQPDKEKGRRLKISPSPTKVFAENAGIPVYQPADVSSQDSVKYLRKLGVDLFVVIAFGQILKKDVLEIPAIYCINIHGSLLPKYRGAAPTNWAIINGDKKSGVTVIKMNEKMDEGEIILKKEMVIDKEDTNITLSEKLSDLGQDALMEAIELIAAGKATLTKQDSSIATYAPKLKKRDGLINWDEPAVYIHNKVKGFLPWPGAYTYFKDRAIKVLKTGLVDERYDGAKNGQFLGVIKGSGMIIKAADKGLLIQYVQIEGKKPMDAESFLRGHRIQPGYVFTAP